MLQTFLTIAPLFLIIFGAAIAQKLRKGGEDWQHVLNEFALKVGLPALIFAVLSKVDFQSGDYGRLIWVNSVFLIANFALAFLIAKLFRLSKKMTRTLFICLPFGNVAYLGIPALEEVLGSQSVAAASLIVAIYVFWMFTIGLGYLNSTLQKGGSHALNKTLMSLIKNPLLISVVLGILVATLNIPIPQMVVSSIDMLAASVTPVVLVVIGLFIGKSKFGQLKEWLPIFSFASLVLLVVPALFYGIASQTNLSGELLSASILQAAMPMAITPFALADEFDLDKKFVARSIELSTVLAVFTIPLWSLVL